MDRRDVLAMGGAAVVSGLLARRAFSQTPPAGAKLRIGVYSGNLQWLRTAEEVALACVEMSAEGLDLTVRPGGHVDPARVGTDLAPFVATIRRHGLTVDSLTCPIVDADSPNAERILDAAASAGVRTYVWGGLTYDLARPIQPQLDALRPRVQRLATLNERYGMKAMYRNGSGAGAVGSLVYDLADLLRGIDPRFVGVQCDTGRAALAGGGGAWEISMRALGPYLAGVSLTDALLRLNL
ncbi:MAG: xylose isomerase-like enzyme, partial [Caulobacteraceae bacterium]|nr:xylose isomerase-like enzyme [Caulobacteraceae bacterium]